jgi:VanZ family protein
MMDTKPLPKVNITDFDKFVHFIMFFTISGVIFFENTSYFRKKISTWKIIIYSFFFPVIYGGLIEIAQEYFAPTRMGDWMDFWFNVIGAFFGLIICLLINRSLNLQHQLKETQHQLERREHQLEVGVYIDDYNYTPKHRSSLSESKIGEIMDQWYSNNKNETIELVRKFCSFEEFYKNIPVHSISGSSLHWGNGWVSPFDAISIYGFLAIHNPRYYVEVGSGNTTLFAAQSIRDNNLRTKIISIDPCPRAEIDKICDKIYRMPFEDMDIDFFLQLSAEDILLVDNSHRSFPNSDVTVFFMEVLPKLPSGMLCAIHDIFLPSDYPEQWKQRWYNEQYLLGAYLLGGADDDEIICPNNFIYSKKEVFEIANSLWGKCGMLKDLDVHTCFFWLKKR